MAATIRTSTGCRVAPTALELAVLEDAEQLRLQVERQLADLVEEDRAAVRLSNAPLRRRSAPVNAPFSWPNSSDSMSVSAIAEQSTDDERPRRARRSVDRAGDELLAGAGHPTLPLGGGLKTVLMGRGRVER